MLYPHFFTVYSGAPGTYRAVVIIADTNWVASDHESMIRALDKIPANSDVFEVSIDLVHSIAYFDDESEALDFIRQWWT